MKDVTSLVYEISFYKQNKKVKIKKRNIEILFGKKYTIQNTDIKEMINIYLEIPNSYIIRNKL